MSINAHIRANFLFIYGNDSNLTVRNLGTEGISIGNDPEILEGSSSIVNSKISLSGFCISLGTFNSNNVYSFDPEENFIDIGFDGNKYTFPITEFNQVIFGENPIFSVIAMLNPALHLKSTLCLLSHKDWQLVGLRKNLLQNNRISLIFPPKSATLLVIPFRIIELEIHFNTSLLFFQVLVIIK